jgi:hypothetical protein
MIADSGAQRQNAGQIVQARATDETGQLIDTRGRGNSSLAGEILFAAEYAIPGVIGFALGGLLWSLIQVFFPGYTGSSYSGIFFWIAGGCIFGFSGGFLVDILPDKRLKMALFSTAAYAIGLALMVFAVELIMQGKQVPGGLLFALGIVAVGFIFGLPLKRSKLFVLLGACGFIAGGVLGLALYRTSIFLIQITHAPPLIGYLPGVAMLVGLGIGTGILIGLGKYIVETK